MSSLEITVCGAILIVIIAFCEWGRGYWRTHFGRPSRIDGWWHSKGAKSGWLATSAWESACRESRERAERRRRRG